MSNKLTKSDLTEFVGHLCIGLNPPATGALVPTYDIVGLDSDAIAEDGLTRVRLYDLMSGRIGCQIDDEPIRYCD